MKVLLYKKLICTIMAQLSISTVHSFTQCFVNPTVNKAFEIKMLRPKLEYKKTALTYH